MQSYQVVLKDSDGYEISRRESEGMKQAKEMAKYLASEQFAAAAEYTRQEGERVEVIDDAGDCVWDMEVKVTA